MEHYETKTETRQFRNYIKTTCDVCGEDMKLQRHEVNNVDITHEKGEDSWGDRFTKTLEIDMCGDCFEKHIIPVLQKLGIDTEYK